MSDSYDVVRSDETYVEIDPNVRIWHNWTYSGLEDIWGVFPEVGDGVNVFERESRLVGGATVQHLDRKKQLVFLSVDWEHLYVDEACVQAILENLYPWP